MFLNEIRLGAAAGRVGGREARRKLTGALTSRRMRFDALLDELTQKATVGMLYRYMDV